MATSSSSGASKLCIQAEDPNRGHEKAQSADEPDTTTGLDASDDGSSSIATNHSPEQETESETETESELETEAQTETQTESQSKSASDEEDFKSETSEQADDESARVLNGTQLSGECIYEANCNFLFSIGSRGSAKGQLTWPRGLVVGGDEIVVADSSNHRVQVFDLEGNFSREFGSYGSGPSEFDCLAGVALRHSSSGQTNYVVSDRYNHRVQVFDTLGKLVLAFGEMGKELGKFNLPWGVVCDDSTGLMYICDKENHRIQIFDENGIYQATIGPNLDQRESNPNQSERMQFPHYLSVNTGKLAVTDTNNHRVLVFSTTTGNLISSLGSEGSGEGQFKFPRGIAMDENGFLIVGDSGNNRLQIFRPNGKFLRVSFENSGKFCFQLWL